MVTGWAGALKVPGACCTYTTASAFELRPPALTVPVMLPSDAGTQVANPAAARTIAEMSMERRHFMSSFSFGARTGGSPRSLEGEAEDYVQGVVVALAQVALVLRDDLDIGPDEPADVEDTRAQTQDAAVTRGHFLVAGGAVEPGIEDVVRLHEPGVVGGLDLQQEGARGGIELAKGVLAVDVGGEDVEVAPIAAGEESGAQEVIVPDEDRRARLVGQGEANIARAAPVGKSAHPERVVPPVLVRRFLAPPVPVQAHAAELVVEAAIEVLRVVAELPVARGDAVRHPDRVEQPVLDDPVKLHALHQGREGDGVGADLVRPEARAPVEADRVVV